MEGHYLEESIYWELCPEIASNNGIIVKLIDMGVLMILT